MSNNSIACQSDNINGIEALQAVQWVRRHLQIPIDKNCAALYFAGKVWPGPGERNNRFFALIAELKRLQLPKNEAEVKILEYFRRIPSELILGGGSDGLPFTESEVLTTLRSVYRDEEDHCFGCLNHYWDDVCFKDCCDYDKRFHPETGKINRGKLLFEFTSKWLPDLKGNDLKIYLAIDLIERMRKYSPGSQLFVTWKQIANVSGVCLRRVGDSLDELKRLGLIEYQKGQAFQRGEASSIKRIIPVPRK
ncbi:MAG: hypothetical protein ACM3YE_01080 [Bacteroidota bacterium]